MDNLTHTLAGALIGEATAAFIGVRNRPRVRAAMLGVAMVASNLPDTDLLYTTLTRNRLDYLLEHRGHTHTAIVAAVFGLLLAWLALWWLRRRGEVLDAAPRRALFGVGLACALLHLLLDYGNNYGVHPWWPLDTRWVYGDSVFIIEPLLWASTAPLLLLWRSWFARGVIALTLVAGVVLAMTLGRVPWPSLLGYGVLALGLLALARRLQAGTVLLLSIGLWLLVTAGFAAMGVQVDRTLLAASQQRWPQARVVDPIRTPAPMQPWCWAALLVVNEGEDYILRRAVVDLAGGRWKCEPPVGEDTQAPLVAVAEVAAAGDGRIRWDGEIRMSRAGLRALWESGCQGEALLRFARAPWFDAQRAGDLRYDRGGDGFTSLDRVSPPACPLVMAPWTPPRADLLAPGP